MIIELLLLPIVGLLNLIVSLVPDIGYSTISVVEIFRNFIALGLYFFGTTPFVLVLGSVVFWSGVHFAWAIIEWVYKKIPGVD